MKERIKLLEKSKLEVTFTDKKITSFGGLSLLAKLFEKINFKEEIEHIIPIKEVSSNSKGIASKVLKFA